MSAPRVIRRRPAAAAAAVTPQQDDSEDEDTFARHETTGDQLRRQPPRRTSADSDDHNAHRSSENDDNDAEAEADGDDREYPYEGEYVDENGEVIMPDTAAADRSLTGLKEIGNLASWTVSTAKPGNGIEQLRDEDTTLFWQSDGPQPHHINIHFAKRVKVKRMRMYLDFENDESYTPTKMSVLSGTGHHDLVEVTKLDLERPTGWIEVNLDGVHEDGELRTFLIQVAIHANHQNGKDTHVRGLQIFAAEPCVLAILRLDVLLTAPRPAFNTGDIPFTNMGLLQEMELR